MLQSLLIIRMLMFMFMVMLFDCCRHLGENVVGLRGLVDQVYRHMHHKVNREDIKNLVSAKYNLLSHDPICCCRPL